MTVHHRPVNVVYVIGQLTIGGTQRQLLLLVEHLDRSRFQPTVVCLSKHALLASSLQNLGCPTYVLDRGRHGRARTLLQVYQILRSVEPSIVHSFAYASRAGIPAAKLARVSYGIVSIRTDPYREMKLLDRFSIALADLVLANSQHIASTIRFGRPSASPKYRVIHNGLDVQAFDRLLNTPPVDPIPGDVLRCPTRNIICAVATLRPVKCLETLLKAHFIVLSQIPQAQLWLIGDGPVRGELELLARDLGINPNTTFWGMRSDVPAILNQAAIGVLSSRVEGLSNAIIEYMAARLPVVATSVGGNPELVLHGETGLLVPPNDPQALADAIVYILRNPEVARQFGEAGRRRVEEHFTVERMVCETESVYEELLSCNDR